MNLPVYGVVAEFTDPTALVAAARKTREAGYRRFEAYAPFPIEELTEAVGHPHTRLPLMIFLGGLFGALGGYFLQYYFCVLEYPLDIGGRPHHSWPAFIPVTFECTILAASLTAVFGMLARNGLPMPYHPLFYVPRFARASRDLFFLCIQARDPLFDLGRVREFLQGLGPADVQEVPQ
jgi:Alternative complex III, ActD subunit